MAGFPLGKKAIESGYRVIGFDTVGSTNTEAMKAAQAGDGGRLWFAALGQTQGRGRRGRHWQNPHGNLAASLLMVPDAPAASLAGLGFVAGVAVQAAVSRLVAPDVSIALKWPNDLLADGAKLCGILLEAQNRPDGRTAVIVGIGINVVAEPEGLPYRATSLRALGCPLDAAATFEALAESWAEWYEVWNDAAGIARIIDRWRPNAAGIGSEVTIERKDGPLRGVFETIDDAGHLIVRDSEGNRTAITVGDVHFGATAPLQ